MNLTPSPRFTRQSLASHSWLGLLAGALMYLVCLSGTLAVFFEEFERWEQPAAAESRSYDAAAVERAYRALAARGDLTHHMYVTLPTESMPRTAVGTEHQSWVVGDDGSLGVAVSTPWTDLLVDLHLYLHLPASFGMIVVSALGAILCGLVISGLMAHRRIFKDAFLLRLRGSRHLEQADLHNRLSVWAAPFHLMIGITGAYFGLAGLIGAVLAAAYFDGDRDAVTASVFGEEPQLQQSAQPLELRRALDAMPTLAPEAEPFFVTVEDAGTPEQYMIVSALHRGRLIYAEQYNFDTAGNYLGKVGYSDGDPGRQAIFSVYRLHFGHFGGFPVKVLYGVLGLALTAVSVTGVNIWLARRRRRDAINDLWVGFVWGTPLALTLAAIAQVLAGVPSMFLLWVVIGAAMALGVWSKDEFRTRRWLQIGSAVALGVLVAGHLIRFEAGASQWVPVGVNACLLLAALVLLGSGLAGVLHSGRRGCDDSVIPALRDL